MTGNYVWTLPDLNPNEKIVIQVTGTIDPTLPENFSIVNIANVSSGVSELREDNNQSTAILGGRRMFLPIVLRQ